MTWQETAQDYFDHHKELTETSRQWLRDNVVLECPLLQEMEPEALLQTFTGHQGFSSAALVRTLVWQTLARVLCGDVDPPAGNVRGFWYEFTDPLFTQFKLYHSPKLLGEHAFRQYAERLSWDFPYDRYTGAELVEKKTVSKSYSSDVTEDMLAAFVTRKVFRYQEPFLFANPSGAYQLVGTHTASLVFVIEKIGLFSVCRKYNSLYHITVMCSQGNPSWVALEY